MQFYEFSQAPFRDELKSSFILPAINWLLGDYSSPYLLPQISGSHWECAIAVESLLMALDTKGLVRSEQRELLENKVLKTVNWLIKKVSHDDSDQTCNWDGATWDTAICARCIFIAEDWFDSKWTTKEKKELKILRTNLVRWLIKRGINWDKDVRYPAGPPDLAQVLNTLILVSQKYPSELSTIEKEFSLENEGNILDRMTKIIMGMEEKKTINLDDGDIEVSYWADCFNTSEVAEGLAAYIKYYSYEGDEKLIKEVKASLYKCIQYIEENQDSGTWGGVADSCGTLYGYLQVTENLIDVSPKDYIVFQALRWMCDKNQVFSDGSFLHSSYITVFYLLALLKVYEKWELGNKSTLEVYDIALWNIPAQGTSERSKRLELQLELEDKNQEISDTNEKYLSLKKRETIVMYLIIEFLILFIILIISGIIDIDWNSLDFNIKDSNKLLTVLGIGIPIIAAITPVLMAKRTKSIKNNQ